MAEVCQAEHLATAKGENCAYGPTLLFYLPLIRSQNVFDRLFRLHQNQSSLYHVSSNGLDTFFLVHRYLLVQPYMLLSDFSMKLTYTPDHTALRCVLPVSFPVDLLLP